MSLSIRDQLLRVGLVNKKQANQVGKDKHKQQRLVYKGQIEADNSQVRLALEVQADKFERDQDLNRQYQEKSNANARNAQVKQLVEASRLPKLNTDEDYNFVDSNKVKSPPVNMLMRNKLSNGSLAIVRYGGRYEVIPREAALKLQELAPERIVQLIALAKRQVFDGDDPYAAYQIPDDLMW